MEEMTERVGESFFLLLSVVSAFSVLSLHEAPETT
jgi:hypothetical protein